MRDSLNVEEIRLGLETEIAHLPIEVYETLGSTNVEVKEFARRGALHGLTVLAEEQTAGRGRLGRDFYSPADTGIYMSILLRPELEGADAVLITTAASVAVCRAIRNTLGRECCIKWVNDVYFGDRKICGILTEAVTGSEPGKIDAIIVGIGINYRTKDFPEELSGVAGSVAGESDVPRNRLVAALLNEFWAIYHQLPKKDFLEEYKACSNVLGRDVRYLENGLWQEAYARDIDDKGGLVIEVREPDGNVERRVLHTGEITLRVRT